MTFRRLLLASLLSVITTACDEQGILEPTLPLPDTIEPVSTPISAGQGFACTLTATGTTYCWGSNFGWPMCSEWDYCDWDLFLNPTLVESPVPFRSISAGGFHVCAIGPSDLAYCWGRNDNGQLGDGMLVGRTVPAPVTGNLRVASISAGRFHTCAVTTSGELYCWGSNYFGQLGIGSTTDSAIPAKVISDSTFATVSASEEHTCALTKSGAASCWGRNDSGKLGTPTPDDRHVPTLVATKETFTAITAGYTHTCALRSDGGAFCWGFNGSGQLGDGSTVTRFAPTVVAGSHTFASISAGWLHTCATTVFAEGYCWGWNSPFDTSEGPLGGGLLGDGTTIDRLVPTSVTGRHRFTHLSAGYQSTCGLAAESTVLCWGWGPYGDGTRESSPIPVLINLPGE